MGEVLEGEQLFVVQCCRRVRSPSPSRPRIVWKIQKVAKINRRSIDRHNLLINNVLFDISGRSISEEKSSLSDEISAKFVNIRGALVLGRLAQRQFHHLALAHQETEKREL